MPTSSRINEPSAVTKCWRSSKRMRSTEANPTNSGAKRAIGCGGRTQGGDVGVAAIAAYLLFRLRPRVRIAVVIGAGLAYAWVDFVNKLLANDISKGDWVLAVVWLVLTVAFGALAFLEETTALQVRPAVTVAPVNGAVQDPLPVLMALWAGVEVWGSASHNVAPLAAGLALVTAGGALLGRSQAVARVSGEEE